LKIKPIRWSGYCLVIGLITLLTLRRLRVRQVSSAHNIVTIVIKFFYNYGNKRNNNQNNTLILKNYYYRKGTATLPSIQFHDQPPNLSWVSPEFCRDRTYLTAQPLM